MNRIAQTVLILAKDDKGQQIIVAPLEFDGERIFVIMAEYYIKNNKTGCKEKVEINPKHLYKIDPKLGTNYQYQYKGEFIIPKDERN